jgi:hypothetical protein
VLGVFEFCLAGGLLALRWRPRRPLFIGTLAVFPLAAPMLAIAAGLSTIVIAAAAEIAGLCLEQFGVQCPAAMKR